MNVGPDTQLTRFAEVDERAFVESRNNGRILRGAWAGQWPEEFVLPGTFRPSDLDRRSFLKWSAFSGLLAAVPGLACAADDEGVFATESTNTTSSPATTSTDAPATTEAPTTTQQTTTLESSTTVADTTTPPTTEAANDSPGAAAGLATGELAIKVTYAMGAGGKKLNPYIAIWIENQAGDVVRTMEVWYQQSEKGPRWLPDLKRWFVVDQARIEGGGGEIVDTVSRATRQPGEYTFVWDGLDQNGDPVPDEIVVTNVESARENGPYSLIRGEVTRGTGQEIALDADGELSAASVIVGI